MSVEDDEASTAGAESVQDSLRATVDKVMAVALTQSGVKTSVGRPSRWSADASAMMHLAHIKDAF